MQYTHSYKREPVEPARLVGSLADAALYQYRKFSEGYASTLKANVTFVEGLFEAGRALSARAGRQQDAVARAYADLFCTPFQVYSGIAASDEPGEDDMRSESNMQKERQALVLADGTYVSVREIQSQDAPALQRLIGRLSERTIQLRYFGPMKELSDKKARHFAEVDGVNRCALVALDPEDEEEIVAVVRYDREDGMDTAEYAALVEDGFQGRGLGIGLTRALIEKARERGVKDFEALVMPQNRGMISMLRNLDLPEQVRWENGVKRFSIQLFP